VDKTPEQLVREALEGGKVRNWIWDEDGETIVGQLVDGFVAPTKFNPECKVLTLLLETSERVNVWLGSSVLENKVMDRRPRLGDTLGIQRLGKVTPKDGGNDYWDWNVVVHGATGAMLSFLSGPSPAAALGPATGTDGPEQDAYPEGATFGSGRPPTSEAPPTGDVYEVQDAEVVSDAPKGW
jgi:hypothetical protein